MSRGIARVRCWAALDSRPTGPLLNVMAPIQISATYGNVTFPIYTGFVQAVDQQYPTIADATTGRVRRPDPRALDNNVLGF